VLRLKGAKSDHSDLVFTVDRNDAPAAYTQTYTTTDSAVLGATIATITFYAIKGGQGAVVAVASKSVKLGADGGDVGDIDTVGTIASVAIVPGQSVLTGVTQDLQLSALDANGNAVAVTPGSAAWSVDPSQVSLALSPSGAATGVAPGFVSVSVTLDGKSSPAAMVPVVTNPIAPISSVIAEATTTAQGPSVRIRWTSDSAVNAAVHQYALYRLPDFPFVPFGSGGGLNGGGGGGNNSGGGGGAGGSGNGGGSPGTSLPVAVATPTVSEIADQLSPFFPFGQGGSSLLIPGSTGCGTILPPQTDAGFTPGQTYTYEVVALASVGGNAACFQTNGIVSGTATPIVPAALSSPADNSPSVNIHQFAPTFGSRAGADLFQLEVSTDSTFKIPGRIFHTDIASTSPVSDGSPQSLPQPLDLATVPELLADPAFSNFVNHLPGAGAPKVYWRVGARHDSDVPGPVHFISRNPTDPDRTFRWVYGPAFTFTAQ
jgi:hypothetical protein